VALEQPFTFCKLAAQPSWGAALTPRHDKGSAVGQPQRPDGARWQVALTHDRWQRRKSILFWPLWRGTSSWPSA